MYKSDRIVIVGGGTAGWFSATTLKRFFPNKDITVIESPKVPIVGVGESTLAYFTTWLALMGIDEKDLFKYTDASYKLSIKFTDFFKKDYGAYHYPFGRPNTPEECFANLGIDAWMLKKSFYPETRPEDYCRTIYPGMPLIENNKISKNENGEFGDYEFKLSHAYHFDATRFGIFLRDHWCKPRGVKHIAAEVKKVVSGADGIEEVVLDDGTIITGDLYIDCTGWKSMLLEGEMGEEFISYNHLIPNNKAWATKLPYVDKEKELEPYTNSTAINNGWVWNIPLWSRIGTGYVYSDKYVDKEDALEEFKKYLVSDKMIVQDKSRVEDLQFKDISMKIGIHRRNWVKNVVAIGLSSGFIEPLESTGLFTVHEFLMKLVTSLDRGDYTQFDIDTYNVSVREMFDGMCKFVALHYSLSHRTDTEYWRDITRREYMGDLVDNRSPGSDMFSDLVLRKMVGHSHATDSGTHCVCNGMNYNILTLDSIIKAGYYHYTPDVEEVKNTIDAMIPMWEANQERWKEEADKCPTLYQYLKDNFYNQ